MPVDMTAAANNAAAVKAALATLKTDWETAKTQVTTLSKQIDTLRKASVPASEIVPFLKEYIDAKANEFVAILNEEIGELVYPNRGMQIFRNQREPITFDELEALLKKDGESLLGSDYWLSGGMGNGVQPGYKLLRLLTSGNDFGWGRAFCFYFGANMKTALDANAAKIVVPPVPANKLDNSTRAQRRTTLASLETRLATAKTNVKSIQTQMESLGAKFNSLGELVSH